jgi:hypothetical protein
VALRITIKNATLWIASCFTLNVTIKPVMSNVVVPSVFLLNVVAPFELEYDGKKGSNLSIKFGFKFMIEI